MKTSIYSRPSYLLAALTLIVFSFYSPALSEETIKIVSSLPRTGSANAQSTSIINGLQLAFEEVNNKVGPYTISLLDWDDASPERGQWDPAIEAANAERAIADPQVMIYVGPYNSGAAKISLPKLNQAGLATISGFATWPGLTKPGVGEANEPAVYQPSGEKNLFRVIPADDIQGAVAAKWAAELKTKRVFVLHDRELYGKGIAEMFRKSATANNLEIVGFEGIDAKAANYKSLVTKIRQQNPDLVYFGGTTQTNGGQILKDLRAGGVTVPMMVPDGCFERAFILAAGKGNVEGSTYFTFGGVPPQALTGKGAQFVANYRKRFGADPEAYAVYGYEVGRVAVDAIKRAGVNDRAAIRKAAAATSDFEGVLGKWSFDQNGDTTLRIMSGNTVVNGEFKFDRLLEG